VFSAVIERVEMAGRDKKEGRGGMEWIEEMKCI